MKNISVTTNTSGSAYAQSAWGGSSWLVGPVLACLVLTISQIFIQKSHGLTESHSSFFISFYQKDADYVAGI